MMTQRELKEWLNASKNEDLPVRVWNPVTKELMDIDLIGKNDGVLIIYLEETDNVEVSDQLDV